MNNVVIEATNIIGRIKRNFINNCKTKISQYNMNKNKIILHFIRIERLNERSERCELGFASKSI